MNVKKFSVGAVYTLATGRTFAPFDEIHEAAEFVLGAPIWTHHFAIPEVWVALKAAVSAQYPALAALEIESTPDADDQEARQAWASIQIARMEALVGGQTLPLIPAPAGSREPMSPLDGIPERKEVIVVEADPDAGPEGIQHAARQVKAIIERDRAG